MNPQNNIDSQRSMENPGPAPSTPLIKPGSSRDSDTAGGDREIKSPPRTNDDMATGARQDEEQDYNEKQDDKKRYDEADPNWRNPDVEMDSQLENTVINPELESNIGPQS